MAPPLGPFVTWRKNTHTNGDTWKFHSVETVLKMEPYSRLQKEKKMQNHQSYRCYSDMKRKVFNQRLAVIYSLKNAS
ncbi:unnamed protein product [Sphenostylis stenocarpa]|uniref:Uncharacterized protein n=1 Tax=Sphenostylis stenocarpa TaxID=92480 RepID=A0AA86S0P7_9FABA|nr:unnamed protein product [Sphenostylis stenocarpa]